MIDKTHTRERDTKSRDGTKMWRGRRGRQNWGRQICITRSNDGYNNKEQPDERTEVARRAAAPANYHRRHVDEPAKSACGVEARLDVVLIVGDVGLGSLGDLLLLLRLVGSIERDLGRGEGRGLAEGQLRAVERGTTVVSGQDTQRKRERARDGVRTQ